MLKKRQRWPIVAAAVLTAAILFLLCYYSRPKVTVHPAPMETAPAVTIAEFAAPKINTPLVFTEYDYKVFYDIDRSNDYLTELYNHIDTLDAAIYSDKYTTAAIDVMSTEVVRLYSVITDVTKDIERYTAWEQEYYYAAKTWEFLMQHGYSEAVASGIIGNMMVETSGMSMSLRPTIYCKSGCHYGLCQWSKTRKPKSADGSDASFEEQLAYLHEDIPVQFKMCGRAFKTNYEKFLAINDPAKAALIFAKVYERCNSGSYGARQRAARIVYKYFTSDN